MDTIEANGANSDQQATQLIQDGQARLDLLQEIINKSNTKEAEITALQDKIQNALSVSETNNVKIEEIATHAIEAQKQIDSLYVSSKTNNEQIINCEKDSSIKKEEIVTQHKQVQDIKANIEKLNTEATSNKEQIVKLAQESQQKSTEISEYHKSFKSLQTKLDDPADGLVITLTKTGNIYKEINEINEKASKAKEEVISNKVKTDDLLNQVSFLKGSTDKVYTESTMLKEEIGKILDLVRDTGLANSFDRRRKRSQTSVLILGGVILAAIGISFLLIHDVFLSEDSNKLFSTVQSDFIKFLIRLTLTSPGVFLIWFSSSQFSRERYFLEQYEFKTAAALALENYTKLLRDKYANKEEEIFSLSIDLIKNVYKEPEYFKPKSTNFFGKFKTPKGGAEVKVEQVDE